MQNIVTQFVKYEAGSEEGVAALLAATLLRDADLPTELRTLIDELDIGNLSAESNVGEEELETLRRSLWKKRNFTLVVGADLYDHPKAESIARLLAAIERYGDFDVLLVPPATNARGVAEICTLDPEPVGYTVGYNAPGDFVLSALGGGDLDMPALNQQEGTFTTVDQRVVPTHPAVPYGGYTLNQLCNALGVGGRYTIDQTPDLPASAGYRSVAFDDLPDFFDATGAEHRGYRLERVAQKRHEHYDEPEDLPTYDGVVVYRCNIGNRFNPFTAQSALIQSEALLSGSEQFAVAAKLQDGQQVHFELEGRSFVRTFRVDPQLKGTIALYSDDDGLASLANGTYRFATASIAAKEDEDA
jgi:NADH-quinone oxidoreductase subunit G